MHIIQNLYNQLKRTAKQSHYKLQIEKYENDIKLIWKMISSLLGNSNDKSNIRNIYKYNNEVLSTPNDMRNMFCAYFTEIGPSLGRELHISTNDYYNRLKTGKLYCRIYVLNTN